MKKTYIILIIFLFSNISQVFAQLEAETRENKTVLYTVLINVVPDNFKFPMIGFVNYLHGSHNNLQAGFINTAKGKTNGAQLGYINTSVGGINGYQGAFINVCGNDLNGVQTGFVNAVGSKTNGAQFGFVNISAKGVDGVQFGFVNASAGKIDGIQAAYVNAAADSLDGIQLGFVNVTAKDIDGAQIGFVNRTRRLDGFQCGFINIADSVEEGAPLAFISFVKKGGYRAFGYYADEYSPLNFSFRIGIKKLYSSFNYSALLNQKNISSYAFGFGSIMSLHSKLFFNPELLFHGASTNTSFSSFQARTVFKLSVGYDLSENLHLSLGPAISYAHSIDKVNTVETFNWLGRDIHGKINPGFSIGINYAIF